MYPYSRLKRFSRPLTTYQKVVRGRAKFQALVRGVRTRRVLKGAGFYSKGKYAEFRRKIFHGYRSRKYSVPQALRAIRIRRNRFLNNGFFRLQALVRGNKARKIVAFKKRASTIVNPYKKKVLKIKRYPLGMVNPYKEGRARIDYKYRLGDAKLAHYRINGRVHPNDDGRYLRVDFGADAGRMNNVQGIRPPL